MNYAQIGAAVYQACNHFDPYLPPLSAELAKAWGRQFAKHNLSIEDLMLGVDRVYDEHGSGYRPLPKDITDAARAIRRDRSDRESDAERAEREKAWELKAMDDRQVLRMIAQRTGQSLPGREIGAAS